MERRAITPSPHQLRALTHPARLRMLGLLRVEGPSTATALAHRLGLNTGATSYHLRQLAEHGFIEDDAERGTTRERWWRAVHTSTVTERPAADDVDGEHDLDAYVQTVVTVYAELLQRAVEERPLVPDAWRDVSTFSDYMVRLTPARAEALLQQVTAILGEEPDDEESQDAAVFVINLNAFPMPGAVTEDRS